MYSCVLKLELVSEVIVGSVEREERLKALIYSAVYLKVSLLLLFLYCSVLEIGLGGA